MSHNRPPLFVIIIVALLILSAGAYFIFFANPTADNSTALTASGTVETTEINIAPELAGKVLEVLVSEGDTVKKGDVLFRLDDALLKAQQSVAIAALETAKSASQTADSAEASAQSQYNLALNNAETQAQSSRSDAWKTPAPADFDQPQWYYTQSEQLEAARTQVDSATGLLKKAQDNQTFVEQKSTSADFLDTEKRLLDARIAFQIAQDVLDRTDGASDGQELKDAAQKNYDDAAQELDDAQVEYEDALTTEGANDVLAARAEVAVAQETYDSAKDRVRGLQTGTYSLQLEAAGKQLDQAKSAAEQAHTAVNQAQANLDLIDTQISKLTISAPADAVVLTRLIEPGEVVNPGSTAFSLGMLGDQTITVYIPEDRYGELSLGQSARVISDSFVGETFPATVIHISDQAEFTPRNVQTAEGRKSTVFAIKLRLDDPESKLKPGMPADVTFEK